MSAPSPFTSLMTRAGLWSVAVVACLAIAGCGDKKEEAARNSVSGKVTLNDKIVSGTVVFVFADGKDVSGPIGPEGTYTIETTVTGPVKVYVKAPFGGAAPPMPKGGPEMPKDMGGGGIGVAPPAKYTAAATSGLTYDIKAGKQTYDIPLK